MDNISKNDHATTRNWKVIKASPEKLYRAFTDPEALAHWMAPGEMTAKVHHFNLKVGGGYEMSLFYPPSEKEDLGKTSKKEDRYTSRFVELSPFKRIVQAIAYNSENPAFWGEMIMETLFDITDKGTRVTILFRNIPIGIRPEDNKMGTRLTLQKLASYIEILP